VEFIFIQQVVKAQKLRLLYECNPMAFIVSRREKSDGFGRIMEIQPTELHERYRFLRQLQYGRKKEEFM
jgi:fructose-1,6-bisphosphatase I